MSARDDSASIRVLERRETLEACVEDDWVDGRKVPVLVDNYCPAAEIISLRGTSDEWYRKKRAGARHPLEEGRR